MKQLITRTFAVLAASALTLLPQISAAAEEGSAAGDAAAEHHLRVPEPEQHAGLPTDLQGLDAVAGRAGQPRRVREFQLDDGVARAPAGHPLHADGVRGPQGRLVEISSHLRRRQVPPRVLRVVRRVQPARRHDDARRDAARARGRQGHIPLGSGRGKVHSQS